MLSYERVEKGNKIEINVSLNRKPYGQLWTWKNTEKEKHPWHAQPLDGKHQVFWGDGGRKADGLQRAKQYMADCATVDTISIDGCYKGNTMTEQQKRVLRQIEDAKKEGLGSALLDVATEDHKSVKEFLKTTQRGKGYTLNIHPGSKHFGGDNAKGWFRVIF